MIKVECKSCTHSFDVQEEETSKNCPNCGILYINDAPVIDIEENTLED